MGNLAAPEVKGRENDFFEIYGKRLTFDGTHFGLSDNRAAWERFKRVPVPNPHMTLSFRERNVLDGEVVYIENPTWQIVVSADADKESIRASKNRDAWEEWKIVRRRPGGFEHTIVSVHGTYLAVRPNGQPYQSKEPIYWQISPS